MEGFRPSRRLGQNFLIDENIARKIIRCFTPKPGDVVLEIGPGFGVLTKYLLPVGCRVIAVEIDARLVAELERQFGEAENLTIIHGDFRKLPLQDYGSHERPLRVLGNIPYHITSPVIFKVLENRSLVSDMMIMIQREVAQRIVGRPRTKDYGILSVLCQAYSRPKIEFVVSKNVFSPKPEVDSAVVHIDFRVNTQIEDDHTFFEVVKTAFSKRRKILRNTLKSLPVDLGSLGIDLERRAEELTVEEFIALANTVARKRRD
jgi:16S rRNA (adenine1518-N6/adenine1519-N6)-dimethyltransferase